MTQVRNEDDDVHDLRLTDQAAFMPDNLLDDLLESDRVVRAECFLEACSSKGWISPVAVNQKSFSLGIKNINLV